MPRSLKKQQVSGTTLGWEQGKSEKASRGWLYIAFRVGLAGSGRTRHGPHELVGQGDRGWTRGSDGGSDWWAGLDGGQFSFQTVKALGSLLQRAISRVKT